MDEYADFPVLKRLLPQITVLVADLYKAEGLMGVASLGQSGFHAVDVARGGSTAAPTEDAEEPYVWTPVQYAALLSKGVESSKRIVEFLNALPVGEGNQQALPQIAESTIYDYDELSAALRWLGKFTMNGDLFDESVWCFRYGKPDYPADHQGPHYSTYWFEPDQKEVWDRAAAEANAA